MEKKRRQIYSESFKQEKVSQLESGEVRLVDLKRMYGVSYPNLVQLEEEIRQVSGQRLCGSGERQ